MIFFFDINSHIHCPFFMSLLTLRMVTRYNLPPPVTPERTSVCKLDSQLLLLLGVFHDTPLVRTVCPLIGYVPGPQPSLEPSKVVTFLPILQTSYHSFPFHLSFHTLPYPLTPLGSSTPEVSGTTPQSSNKILVTL